MEKLIFNTITNKHIVLDSNNKVIENLTSNQHIIDIDFNILPSNIFSNISMYLGNDYKCYNIKLSYIEEFLTKKVKYNLKKDAYYDHNKKYMYTVYNKQLYLSSFNIINQLIKIYDISYYSMHTDNVITNLCMDIIIKKYNWKHIKYANSLAFKPFSLSIPIVVPQIITIQKSKKNKINIYG